MNETTDESQLAEVAEQDRAVSAGEDRGGLLGMRILLMAGYAVCTALCVCFGVWWRRSGFYGLEYLLYVGPTVLGYLNFAAVWTVLGNERPLVRWVALPLAILGLSVGFAAAVDAFRLLIELAKMFVAVLLPVVLLYRRGGRLTRTPVSAPSRWSWLSFSIADLMIATTGFAVLLGLVMIEEPVLEDLMFVLAFAAPTYVVVVLGLAGPKRWIALQVLCVPLVLFLGIALLESLFEIRTLPPGWGGGVGLLLLISGIPLLVQTLGTGVMRRLGYRLRRVG